MLILPESEAFSPTDGSRDVTRDFVAATAYAQLSMTDLVDLPTPTSWPRNETSEPRSVAVAGRPFTTEAARWSRGLLQAEGAVRQALDRPAAESSALATPGPRHDSALRFDATDRVSRRLVAAWVCGVLLGDLDSESSMRDTERWFTGATTAVGAMPTTASSRAQTILSELVSRAGALEMLPYALDPVPHEYRRQILSGSGNGAARMTRKKRGSFYTPTDVAEHVVSVALNHASLELHPRVLDPALGTGVFLRATFKALLDHGYEPEEAIACLHGVDIDECAVDMAAFVLFVDYALVCPLPVGETVFERWWRLRSQLLAADSLAIFDGIASADRMFDEKSWDASWLADGFDVIVGNPPYARLGERTNFRDLASRFRAYESATCSTDTYLGFVELLCSQLRPGGAGTLVVPMSIGYSTTKPTRQLRAAAVQSRGQWKFEFFDRTPDALFGDDVKQRNAIVTRRADDTFNLTTSQVMRWSSANRQGLFDRINHVSMGEHCFIDGVPKLGSDCQILAYRILRQVSSSFRSALVNRRRILANEAGGDECRLYVAGTAYNWLNIYRSAGAITVGVDSPTMSPVTELTLNSAKEADAVYSVLSSRLVYWLWRVEGDAFHVPSGWLQTMPVERVLRAPSALTDLAELGRSLWAQVKLHPIVSSNKGKTTVTYCPHACPDLLDEIDDITFRTIGLPLALGDELVEFVRELTTAGRDSQNSHGLRRALAPWRDHGRTEDAENPNRN